jgi:hypothetical protein
MQKNIIGLLTTTTTTKTLCGKHQMTIATNENDERAGDNTIKELFLKTDYI